MGSKEEGRDTSGRKRDDAGTFSVRLQRFAGGHRLGEARWGVASRKLGWPWEDRPTFTYS